MEYLRMSFLIHLHAGSALSLVSHLTPEKEKSEWPEKVNDWPIPLLDTGVFISELANEDNLPQKLKGVSQDDVDKLHKTPDTLLFKAKKQQLPSLSEGTYRGTPLALTKIYDLVEKKYSSFMDAANFEPTVTSPMTLAEKREDFKFTDPMSHDGDHFPPRLNLKGVVGLLHLRMRGLIKEQTWAILISLTLYEWYSS